MFVSKKKKEATSSAVIAMEQMANMLSWSTEVDFVLEDKNKIGKKKKHADLECNTEEAKNIMDMYQNR